MPRYAAHQVVLDRTIAELEASSDFDLTEIAATLRLEPFAASLGAIGADLLSFAADHRVVAAQPQINGAVDIVFRSLLASARNVEDVLATLGNVRNAIATGARAVADFTGIPALRGIGDLPDLGAVLLEQTTTVAVSLVEATFVRLLGLDTGSEYGTAARGLMHGLLERNVEEGREELDWYWSEMLKGRHSGRFLQALLATADTDAKKAYAYGYAIGVATDLVGSPFVNTVVGAPYRMAPQRWLTVANHIDQQLWTDHTGTDARHTLFGALRLDTVDKLPSELASFIAEAIHLTYASVLHPRRLTSSASPLRVNEFLSATDISEAFDTHRLFLLLLGGAADVRPTVPSADVLAELARIWGGLPGFNPPQPPPVSSLPSTLEELLASIPALMASLASWTRWALDAAVYVATYLASVVAGVAQAIADSAVLLVNALLYGVQSLLFSAYEYAHAALALSGFAYPSPEMARRTSELAAALTTIPVGIEKLEYPIVRTSGQSHLRDAGFFALVPDAPNPSAEQPSTTPSPYRSGEAAAVFVAGTPVNDARLRALATAQDPQTSRTLAADRLSMGSSVELAVHFLAHRNDPAAQAVVGADWNLDGDRGYGYRSWDAIPFTALPGEIRAAMLANEDLGIFIEQHSSTWRSLLGNPAALGIGDRYVQNKGVNDLLLGSLTVSEFAIPKAFTSFGRGRLNGPGTERWRELLAPRLRGSRFVFTNGLLTSPSSAARAAVDLERTLRAALTSVGEPDLPAVRLMHNYTSMRWGAQPLWMVGDLIEAAGEDYLQCTFPGSSASETVNNPATIATIALLHDAMLDDRPLLLCGHSQGAMIHANAVLHFIAISPRHAAYTRSRVSMLQLSAEVVDGTRVTLRAATRGYLVYIMNGGDPEGRDALVVGLTAGPIPGLPVGSNLSGIPADIAMALLDLATAPSGPSMTSVRAAVNRLFGPGSALGAIGDLYAAAFTGSGIDAPAHFLPSQLAALDRDIRDDNFRADPATLGQATLSTPNGTLPMSINVQEFFRAAR